MADQVIIDQLKSWSTESCKSLGIFGDQVKSEYPLKIWGDKHPVKADLYIPAQAAHIFIEVESTNGNVDANVVKYWLWMESDKWDGRKIVLFHVLNPTIFKGDNYRSRINIAHWVAGKIRSAFPRWFEYKLIDDLTENGWETQAVKKLKVEIQEICLRMVQL